MHNPFDINNTSLVIARLEQGETVKEFDCGDPDLNDFILNESALYRKEKLADNKTGCRFITVDAYAAAIPFYLRNGFVPLNDEDIDDLTRLLYFDLNDLDED